MDLSLLSSRFKSTMRWGCAVYSPLKAGPFMTYETDSSSWLLCNTQSGSCCAGFRRARLYLVGRTCNQAFVVNFRIDSIVEFHNIEWDTVWSAHGRQASFPWRRRRIQRCRWQVWWYLMISRLQHWGFLTCVVFSSMFNTAWMEMLLSVTTTSLTTTVWFSAFLQLRCIWALLHRLLRSGQSERTPNPGARVSSFPLGFFLNPRKLGSTVECGTLRFVKSRRRDARACSRTAGSSLLSKRWFILVAVQIHAMLGTPNPPSLLLWKIKSLVECALRPTHFLP